MAGAHLGGVGEGGVNDKETVIKKIFQSCRPSSGTTYILINICFVTDILSMKIFVCDMKARSELICEK